MPSGHTYVRKLQINNNSMDNNTVFYLLFDFFLYYKSISQMSIIIQINKFLIVGVHLR